jgi:hypothetical protein
MFATWFSVGKILELPEPEYFCTKKREKPKT